MEIQISKAQYKLFLHIAMKWLGPLTKEVDPEDVVQEGLVKAFETMDKRPATPEKHCIYHVISECRKLQHAARRGEFTRESPLEEAIDLPAAEPMDKPDDEVLELRDSILHKKIKRLPESLGVPLTLHYFFNVPVEQLANRYGITPRAIRYRLDQGRAELRKMLEQDPEFLRCQELVVT